jgi:hypothetical protein
VAIVTGDAAALRTGLASKKPDAQPLIFTEIRRGPRRSEVRTRPSIIITARRMSHNYVAGSATLVDHTRRLMRGRGGAIAEEFERRKMDVVGNAEVPFIKDLRNFVLHRAHPFLGHTVTVANSQGPITGEIELSQADLLIWDRWSSPARTFIKDQGDKIALRPIVQHHGKLMIELHNWLHNELALANSSALEDTNRLVDERNAILTGMDIPAAQRLSEAMTRIRNSPTPIRTEDLPAILRGDQPAPGAEGNAPAGDA